MEEDQPFFFGAGYIEPKKLYQKFKSAKIKFSFLDFLNCHNSTTNKEKKAISKIKSAKIKYFFGTFSIAIIRPQIQKKNLYQKCKNAKIKYFFGRFSIVIIQPKIKKKLQKKNYTYFNKICVFEFAIFRP